MSLFHMRLPEDLKIALAERATARGVTMTEHMTALLRADLDQDARFDARRQWQEENRAGIESWNARVRAEGLPLAHLAVTQPDFGPAIPDDDAPV